MSIRVMTWVWDHAEVKGNDLLVLLAIADHAGDDGGNAYPSVATLARKSRLHARTVQRIIQSLAAQGAVEVTEHGGRVEGRTQREQPNLYRVVMDPPAERRGDPPAPAPGPPRQIASDPPGTRATRTTLVEPPIEPKDARASSAPLQLVSDEAPVVVHAFDAFWKAYPRKVAKPEARKAWDAKVKTAADGAAVLNGLDAWMAYWRARGEERFIPHPSTWLRREGWNDTPPAVPRAQPRGPRWVSTPEEEQAERAGGTRRLTTEELWG